MKYDAIHVETCEEGRDNLSYKLRNKEQRIDSNFSLGPASKMWLV